MHCYSGWDEEGTYVCCWGDVDGEFKVVWHREKWPEKAQRLGETVK